MSLAASPRTRGSITPRVLWQAPARDLVRLLAAGARNAGRAPRSGLRSLTTPPGRGLLEATKASGPLG